MGTLTKTRTLLAALALAVLGSLATATSSSAGEVRNVGSGYCSYTNSWASSEDSGGRNAVAVLYRCTQTPDQWRYRALFSAYGERLLLQDRYTDGHRAWSTPIYRNPDSGVSYNLGTHWSSYREVFELGSAGDVSEGYGVSIHVCIEDVVCSQRVSGRA